MNIVRNIQTVEKLFLRLDRDLKSFSSRSGMVCQSGCGDCCLNPNIHATPLEFLPLALEIYRGGQADDYLTRLSGPLAGTMNCILYNPALFPVRGGGCSNYPKRGLICRLFGFSARKGKDNHLAMITCKIIKGNYPGFFSNENEALEKLQPVPLASDYYARLTFLDPEISMATLPINLAIRNALEEVLAYYAYRKS